MKVLVVPALLLLSWLLLLQALLGPLHVCAMLLKRVGTDICPDPTLIARTFGSVDEVSSKFIMSSVNKRPFSFSSYTELHIRY